MTSAATPNGVHNGAGVNRQGCAPAGPPVLFAVTRAERVLLRMRRRRLNQTWMAVRLHDHGFPGCSPNTVSAALSCHRGPKKYRPAKLAKLIAAMEAVLKEATDE